MWSAHCAVSYCFRPLSCNPHNARSATLAATPTLYIWLMPIPLLRSYQVVPLSFVPCRPPSDPTNTTLGTNGWKAMQCLSECREGLPFGLSTGSCVHMVFKFHKAPPLVVRHRFTPPIQRSLASVGSMAHARSNTPWPPHPCALYVRMSMLFVQFPSMLCAKLAPLFCEVYTPSRPPIGYISAHTAVTCPGAFAETAIAIRVVPEKLVTWAHDKPPLVERKICASPTPLSVVA